MEARRLREIHGDPALQLASIVHETFDEQALDEAIRELNEGSFGRDDDEADE